jgi:glucose-6-phosphate isomerase
MKGIRFDFSGCSNANLGPRHGIDPEHLGGALATLGDYLRNTRSALARGKKGKEGAAIPGFYRLPDRKKEAAALSAYAQSLPSSIENAVILGIGGSSLGPRALIDALTVPGHPGRLWNRASGRKLFFPDNVDPELNFGLLEKLEPKRTLLVVISKSGSTVETAAQLVLFADFMRKRLGPKWKRHVAVVTDPDKGPLRRIAQEQGLASFEVPPDVGGRYSVLTAVGLLPAALGGVKTARLLEGAAETRDALLRTPPERNAAALSAAIHVAYHKAHRMPIRVIMPYRSYLGPMAEWFQQLWAESLGKNAKSGSTPAKAVGVTDQHSQLQLYVEGPFDKVINLWTVEASRADVVIPARTLDPDFEYLAGKSLGELLAAEYAGTRTALALAGRPTIELSLDVMNEERVGAMFCLLEVETALAAELYKVDAYDQPGVELGKKYAFGLFRRAGYESYAENFRTMQRNRTPWKAEIKLA